MKINQTTSADTVATDNTQAKETEKKGVVSRGVGGVGDIYESSPMNVNFAVLASFAREIQGCYQSTVT